MCLTNIEYKINTEYSCKLQVFKSGQHSCDDGRRWHGWSDFKNVLFQKIIKRLEKCWVR